MVIENAIERACIRAFEETPSRWAVPGGEDWMTNAGDPTKENYRIMIRAALAAFLDAVKDSPTEEMLKEGAFRMGGDQRVSLNVARYCWHGMCSALRRGVAGDGK